MQLKDFIKTNLMQINDAVKEIKSENDELAISIAPYSKIDEKGKILRDYEA